MKFRNMPNQGEQGQVRNFNSESEEWFENYNGAPHNIFQFDLQVREALVLKTIKDLAQKNGFARVAEIGCGSCNVLGDTQLHSAQKVGIDFSKQMLEIGKKNYDEIALVNGDSNFLPLKECQFDLVLCLGVVQYIPSYTDAIRELSRILKPGGCLILTVPSKHSIFNIYRKMRRHSLFYLGMKSLIYKALKVNKTVGRQYKMHYFNLEEIDSLLEKNNLKKISSSFHTHGFMKTYRVGLLNKININLSRMLEKANTESIHKFTGWTYVTVSQKI